MEDGRSPRTGCLVAAGLSALALMVLGVTIGVLATRSLDSERLIRRRASSGQPLRVGER